METALLLYPIPLWVVLISILVCYWLSNKLLNKDETFQTKTDIASSSTTSSSDRQNVSYKQPADCDVDYDVKNNYTFRDGAAKLVLCVNMSLGMGKGKIGAQCGHATLGAYKIARKRGTSCLSVWETFGQAKIAVKVNDDDEIDEIEKKAKAKGLITYIVHDAGRTQIAAGSRTVLAIGPAPTHMFEGVSDSLKLL